jgi:FAD/FMN-containing dehydrogenase
MGKSTGAGALAIWTHHLQDIEYVEKFVSPHYSGPAFKLGAGVLGYQIARKAREHGLVVVSGSCSVSSPYFHFIVILTQFTVISSYLLHQSVGVAGGYIQGGGHSTLSSAFGLAADQTLSFEVITTTGTFLTASPTENSDLYWALSGGGGGTYAIVWSVTVKAFPDEKVTVASIGYGIEDAPNEDAYYKGIEAYYASSSPLTEARLSAFTVHHAGRFSSGPFGYNKSTADVEKVCALLSTLRLYL